MAWTPLHAALGEPGGDLTFDLVLNACDVGATERADLDWKRDLPLTASSDQHEARRHQQLELAKDIAAMANSGGGMVVYGVAETRESGASAAERVVPVGDVDETTLRAIRQVAGNLVYPPVTRLELLPLHPTGAPQDGVLALLVPESPDTPHLVRPPKGADWFGVPYRHGPDTEWMVERQIASAYAAREAGYRRKTADFDARFQSFLDTLGGGTDVRWVVAMAVPDHLLTQPRDLTLSRANGIINRAWSSPLCASFGPKELTESSNTTRGLHRFTRVGRREIHRAQPAVARSRIEIHGDGTIAVAFTRDGALPGEGRQHTQVPVTDIESTALDFFALLWQTRSELGVQGDYAARVTVHPPTEIFRKPDSTLQGHLQPWDEQRVYGYVPIDGPILIGDGRETALGSLVALATDAVNQAGAAASLDADHLLTQLWLED